MPSKAKQNKSKNVRNVQRDDDDDDKEKSQVDGNESKNDEVYCLFYICLYTLV